MVLVVEFEIYDGVLQLPEAVQQQFCVGCSAPKLMLPARRRQCDLAVVSQPEAENAG